MYGKINLVFEPSGYDVGHSCPQQTWWSQWSHTNETKHTVVYTSHKILTTSRI